MRFIIFALAILLSGCARYTPVIKTVNTEEVTWIVLNHMAKYKHESGRRLKLEHSDVLYGNEITGLRLEISSQEILEIDEARNLLVDFVEELLYDINTNPIVSQQLAFIPFSADNLDLEINFESFFGEYVDPFYIGCIDLTNGMAKYNAFDLKHESRYSWHSRVESYSKTREISLLGRAADKKFEKDNACPPKRLLEQLYIDDQELRKCRRRKF